MNEALSAKIHIEPYGEMGYCYTMKMPHDGIAGIAGYAPTRHQLAMQIGENIIKHMAKRRETP